jgi:hypothetical protein
MASLSNAGGSRRVIDVLAEMSYHLVEPVLNTTLVSFALQGHGEGGYGVGGYGSSIVTGVVIDVPIEFYLYVGANIILNYQGDTEEIVTVTAVNYGTNSFSCDPINQHYPGEPVFGATFPTQAATDPLFTQAELMAYLSQAQNDFLTKVPLVLELFAPAPVSIGQQYQTLPAGVIELERVAIMSNPTDTAQISQISMSFGTVTAILSAPIDWTPGLDVMVLGCGNAVFDTAPGTTITISEVLNALGEWLVSWPTTSMENTNAVGGVIQVPKMTRLYESALEQITMSDPNWQMNTFSPQPTRWYEDRTGLYGWGLAPVPRSNFFVELLASVTDTQELAMLDSFLLPDCFVPYLKYKAMADALSKDGEQRSPTMCGFFLQRYNFGLMLADRFLRNTVNVEQTIQGMSSQQTGGGQGQR